KRDNFAGFCKELNKKKLILTLSGPRRSGKTFLMKQAMLWLAKNKHIPYKNICYFQFSGSLNEKNIIHGAVDLFLKKYAGKKEKYIFLDEVQYVDFWQDQIKYSYDLLKDVKFIVSGSTSLFYRQKSKESLAGRIVKYKLGALNFHEYLRFKNIEEPSLDRAKFVSNLAIYQTEFKKYLAFGQYPEIVAHPELDHQKYIMDLSDQVINFDIPYFSAKINRQLFFNVVKTLSFDLAQEYSANNLAKTLSSNRREISQYVKILEEIGLFRICYNAGLTSMRKKLSGSKKIYSLNLNLSLHLNGFDISYLNDTRVFGKYFENYIFMRISEKYGKIEYYRINGKELDFVSKNAAFEIKSGANINIDKYQKLSASLKKKFYLIAEEEAYLL
ncbi:MAG: ATP-binding protein, partial [Patescibacteria group bacterium]|nr:ATP-binding protein [Patescibacteria group bacterium]